MSKYLRATALLAAAVLAGCESPLDVQTPAGMSPVGMSASHAATESRLFAVTPADVATFTPSYLYEIDPNTGAVLQRVGAIAPSSGPPFAVLALDFGPDGTLYGSAGGIQFDGLFNGLIEIDPSSAEGVPVGFGWGFEADITELSVDPTTGRIYGWQDAQFENDDFLVEIDPLAGDIILSKTFLSSGINPALPGMDFDASTWWVLDAGQIYTADQSTGALSSTGNIGATAHHGSIDPATGLYYGLSAATGAQELVVADLAAGAEMARHAITFPTGMPAVSFSAVAIFGTAPPSEGPVADAGEDGTFECTCAEDGTTEVTLDGTRSTGTISEWEWTDASGAVIATDENPTVELECGSHVLTLTVKGGGAESSDEVVIDIVDTTAPEIQFSLDQTTLWSPNHDMVTVAKTISASDACDPDVTVEVVVTSDQDTNGTGDGNTETDWEVLPNADGSVDLALRAERTASDGDRTYTITVTATDAAGNSATETGSVTVPKSQQR